MPYNINRKTIIEINVDGPERVDPEWVERREVWKGPLREIGCHPGARAMEETDSMGT